MTSCESLLFTSSTQHTCVNKLLPKLYFSLLGCVESPDDLLVLLRKYLTETVWYNIDSTT